MKQMQPKEWQAPKLAHSTAYRCPALGASRQEDWRVGRVRRDFLCSRDPLRGFILAVGQGKPS